jgi:nitrite reductase/ring-hydroxylating ferredoxin subunit
MPIGRNEATASQNFDRKTNRPLEFFLFLVLLNKMDKVFALSASCPFPGPLLRRSQLQEGTFEASIRFCLDSYL